MKFQIHKKTLLYAESFPEPFFLIHTSTRPEEPVYFVWLQKYISHVIDRDSPNWRNEASESININIPSGNKLKESEDKLIEMSAHNVIQSECLEFLSHYLMWEFDSSELRHGNTSFKDSCHNLVDEFQGLSRVLNKFHQGGAIDFKEIHDCIDCADMAYSDTEALDEFNEALDLIKSAILTRRQHEVAMEEFLEELPY